MQMQYPHQRGQGMPLSVRCGMTDGSEEIILADGVKVCIYHWISNVYRYICGVIIEKAMIMDMYALTDKMILSKIGESVRHLRLEQNISQKELAAAAGTSTSSVAAIERGESVSLKTLVPLLRALNALHMLSDFLKEPEISPIAYARQLEALKSRKRASTSNRSRNENTESEW